MILFLTLPLDILIDKHWLSKEEYLFEGQKWNFPLNEVSETKPDILINHQPFPKEIRGVLIHYSPMKVIAGDLFSRILTVDGKLLTFGLGKNGQLGHLNNYNKPFGFLFEPKKFYFFDN